MGTWGHGYFENDAAFDFMADIEEADNPKRVIKDAFEVAMNDDYLGSDEGSAVIVAATYVDRQLNGTKFSEGERDELLEVDTFPERYPNISFSNLRISAVQALKKVIDGESELNELWAENEDDYPAWRHTVEQLIERLDK